MIRYALVCDASHAFEGWFAGSDAFERQRDGDAIACPLCGSTKIDRALMAPAVSTARRREAMRLSAHVPEAASDREKMVALARKVREHVTQNAEYVGPRFAEEARRIHYDEAERRGIYGEASMEDARALAEEGIEFAPLPVLPEEHN